jgi:replicative DNA helicase
MSDRTLPHNLEAEKCVLGAILIDNPSFNQAAEVIGSDDFFRDAHRRIFEKMIGLSERSQPIDPVTLKDELTRSGELDEVGGPAYVASLTDGVPRSANVEFYAKIVKEKSTLRKLIQSANDVLVRAYDAEEDADNLLDEAERSIFQIAENRMRSGFVSLASSSTAAGSKLEKLQEHTGNVTGVPTGFVDLDEMTSGFQKADLVIVAARPSMGKTSLVLNMALHCGIEAGRTAGVFSLEMSKEQLFMRMLTSEARVDAHKFRGGFLGEQDYARLVSAFARLHDAKVFIDDSPSIGILEMRAKARRLKMEHGPGHAGHRLPAAHAGPREVRQPAAGACVDLALAEDSREGTRDPHHRAQPVEPRPEGRSDHRPQLSDLRESGAMEQDADVVMFIYREEMYPVEGQVPPEAEGVAELIIGKQRNGPTGHREARVPEAVHAIRKLRGYLPGLMTEGERAAASEPRERSGALGPREAGGRGAKPSGPKNDQTHRREGEPAGCAVQPARHRGLLDRQAKLAGIAAPGIIAVVKANAYGHGAAAIGAALEAAGVSMLACADIEEGVSLRDAGISVPILVFGALSVSDLDGVFTHDLTPTVSTPGAARALESAAAARNVRLACHLKIDTGMNRLGFRHDNLRRTMPEVLASPHLQFDAVYTHFATADDPESEFLDEQRTRFDRAAAALGALRPARTAEACRQLLRRCFATHGRGTTPSGRACCSTESCRHRSPPPMST